MSDLADVLCGKTIILGITGSIAAYKSLELIRELRRRSCQVYPVMTSAAQKFIGPVSVETLAGNKVAVDLFEAIDYSASHIKLSGLADAVVVAPATANTVGKIASGIADDLLSALVMAARSPILLAPAMNERMWLSAAVQANVAKLKSLGFRFIGPEQGPLACGASGVGRMSEPSDIADCLEGIVGCSSDFVGRCLVVTAGPTRERLDSVRFLTNRSSGKMGYAVAAELRQRGAKVILISGPTDLDCPYGVELHQVETAAQMQEEVLKAFPHSDGLVMVAAVADYRPASSIQGKIKKNSHATLSLELVPTDDILEKVSKVKGNRLLVGFCAETENLAEHAREKLKKKNLDLIVGNNVNREGIGFGSDNNQVIFVDRGNTMKDLPLMSKREVARELGDAIHRLFKQQTQ